MPATQSITRHDINVIKLYLIQGDINDEFWETVNSYIVPLWLYTQQIVSGFSDHIYI